MNAFSVLLASLALALFLSPACSTAAERPGVEKLLRGLGAEVDPMFPYYADRSAESIASEIKVNGYSNVHYVVTSDANIRADLVNAFRAEGLPVWYVTFCHVAYSTLGFPEGWEAWKMKLRAAPGTDYTRLCMNDPGYTAFKRAQIASVMSRFAFDGVELVEPFWPDVPGPERDTYGCLCEDCRAAFLRDHPEESDIPEFNDASSPRYYKTNAALYGKWMDFRVNSISRFLNQALADARHKPSQVWTLAQEGAGAPALLREAQGMDVAALARDVKPDAVCFQTNWTDWMKPVLPPEYLANYQPFIDRLRAASPKTLYTVQVDTGSAQDARRTMNWLRAANRQALKMCALGTVNYEYFITQSMYEDSPRLMEVRPRTGGVKLVFQKRVDTGRAADVTNYSVKAADGTVHAITGAKADGNQVLLGVRNIAAGKSYEVTIQEIRDTPDRWLFKGYPAHTVRNIRKAFTLP